MEHNRDEDVIIQFNKPTVDFSWLTSGDCCISEFYISDEHLTSGNEPKLYKGYYHGFTNSRSYICLIGVSHPNDTVYNDSELRFKKVQVVINVTLPD